MVGNGLHEVGLWLPAMQKTAGALTSDPFVLQDQRLAQRAIAASPQFAEPVAKGFGRVSVIHGSGVP